ncbi:MAG: hypothetical protein V3V10_04595 [Planctomycetota bacterium]
MQTKTREAVEVILNADESEFREALDALQGRCELEADLTEDEIKILQERLAEFIAGGRKGFTEEEVEAMFQAKGL